MSLQNTSVPRSCERAGQRASTVPTSNPPRLSAFTARPSCSIMIIQECQQAALSSQSPIMELDFSRRFR